MNDLLSTIEAHGYAHVRGVLSPAEASSYCSATITALAAAEKAGEQAHRYLYRKATAASDIREFDDILGGSFEIVRSVFNPAVRAVHEAYLGPGYRICVQQSRIRRQYGNGARPKDHVVHLWHQDAGLGYVPGKMLNTWVALTPCGVTAPSMQMLALYDLPIRKGHGIPDEEIEGPREDLICEAGDAAIFPSSTFHRTQVGDDLILDRYSLDFRAIQRHITPDNMAGCDFLTVDDLLGPHTE